MAIELKLFLGVFFVVGHALANENNFNVYHKVDYEIFIPSRLST